MNDSASTKPLGRCFWNGNEIACESHPELGGVAGIGLDVPEEWAHIFAAAPELLEALEILQACGAPSPVSLYDEEGVEGWEWTHPDGREWSEIGAWHQPPPLHPVAQAAIAKAKGEAP